MTRGYYFAVILLALLAGPAAAHESRPVYVSLTELEPGAFGVFWKVPITVPAKALPAPLLPEHCAAAGDTVCERQAGAYPAAVSASFGLPSSGFRAMASVAHPVVTRAGGENKRLEGFVKLLVVG